MRYFHIIIALSVTVLSCSTEHSSHVPSADESLRSIKLELSDTSWTNVNSLIQMDSYIILSSKIPLGIIERVLVNDEKIYILDNQSRIVCFNFKGEIIFTIKETGKGPGEYYKIIDMIFNPEKNAITVADQGKRKLIHYSARTGKFINEEILKISPDAMAFFNGNYYFYNPYHFNYPDDKSLHYSLIEAKNGEHITNREFPHNPRISDYMFDDCYHQFSYNEDEIYFRKRFIDTVFAITEDGVVPRYAFELPNPLPYEVVEQKPNMLELATKSKYTGTLYNIYRTGNILYCNFFGEEFIASTFYDLQKDEIIYCGNNVWPYPSKELPVITLFDGIYNKNFFSLISPIIIMSAKETNPDAFPKDWLVINENSNPVLAFYKIVR